VYTVKGKNGDDHAHKITLDRYGNMTDMGGLERLGFV